MAMKKRMTMEKRETRLAGAAAEARACSAVLQFAEAWKAWSLPAQ